MSYLLSKTPAWLDSPVFSFSDPGSEIVLLSGDGHQVTVPAVLLLSTSHLVRSLLADHLPPAYSPPAISLPAVTGQVLQVVRQLCTEGRAFVSEERKGEVENVFKMLNVSCQLDGDTREDHGKEMKVGVKSGYGEGAVVQPAYHDLYRQFKGGDEEQVQVELTQDYSDDLAAAQHVEKEITDNVEEEALVAQNIVILEASSSNEVSMHDLPEVEVSPDTFGNESDVDSISELGLRPCTSAMPVISPHTVTATEMPVQEPTEEGQAPVQMETITKLSNKRKGLVNTNLNDQRKDDLKKKEKFQLFNTLGLRPCTPAMPVISPHTVTTTEMSVQVPTEEGQASVQMETITKLSNKRKGLVITNLNDQRKDDIKKLKAFGEMKDAKANTRSLEVLSGKIKSRLRGASVAAGRQSQSSAALLNSEKQSGVSKPVQVEELQTNKRDKLLVSCLRSEGDAVDQGWMTKVKVEVIDGIEKAETAHFKKLEAFGEMKAGKTSTRIITRSLKVDSGKLKSRLRGAGVGAGRQFQGPDGGQEKEHKHGQPSKREKLSRLTKSVPSYILARSKSRVQSKKVEVDQNVNQEVSCQVGRDWMTNVEVINGGKAAEVAQHSEIKLTNNFELEKTTRNVVLEHDRKICTDCKCKICDTAGTKEKLSEDYQFKEGKKWPIKQSLQRKYVCHECGKRFKTRNNLVRHSSVHTKVRSYHCDQCGNQYATAAGLDAHTKYKHQGVKYQCEECGHQCGKKCNLTSHINQVHRRVKLFPCQTCDLSFARKLQLSAHIAVVHENRKDFKCEHCNKSFGSTNNRKVHIERLHVDTNYPCSWPDCRYIGGSKVDLKAHMFVHNKEGYRYWCALCKIGFENCRTKKKHVKTVHPNKLKTCSMPECTFIAYTYIAMWYHTSRAHAKDKN